VGQPIQGCHCASGNPARGADLAANGAVLDAAPHHLNGAGKLELRDDFAEEIGPPLQGIHEVDAQVGAPNR
jgi:hypothetical protein